MYLHWEHLPILKVLIKDPRKPKINGKWIPFGAECIKRADVVAYTTCL
jgi:hypothetical protein